MTQKELYLQMSANHRNADALRSTARVVHTLRTIVLVVGVSVMSILLAAALVVA